VGVPVLVVNQDCVFLEPSKTGASAPTDWQEPGAG